MPGKTEIWDREIITPDRDKSSTSPAPALASARADRRTRKKQRCQDPVLTRCSYTFLPLGLRDLAIITDDRNMELIDGKKLAVVGQRHDKFASRAPFNFAGSD